MAGVVSVVPWLANFVPRRQNFLQDGAPWRQVIGNHKKRRPGRGLSGEIVPGNGL